MSNSTSSGNFAIWNRNANVNPSLSYSAFICDKGGTRFRGNTGGTSSTSSTFSMPSGKWYVELYSENNSVSGWPVIGVCLTASISKLQDISNWQSYSSSTAADRSVVTLSSGDLRGFGSTSGSATGSGSFSDGDIVQIAVDIDAGKWWFGKNGSYMSSGNPAAGSNAIDTFTAGTELSIWTAGYNGSSYLHINAGQDSTFNGNVSAGSGVDDNGFGNFKYSPPSGYLALCSANSPTGSGIDPSLTSTNFPSKQFNVVTYTGNASTNAITGLGFKPDLVWCKIRSGASNAGMVDSSRGTNKVLFSTVNNAEDTSADLSSFDSDGFTLTGTGSYDANFNQNSATYVGWGWKASGGEAQNKTYAVTVVDDGGNKYRLDGHGTSAITIDVNEGSTITFDQSDNTNDGHPLRIYTASDKSGGEYTTGVTTTGTAGQAGAKTVITVAASAPTLYYQCSIHGGMGGQINTNALSAGIGNSHTAGTIITKVQKNLAAGFSIFTYTGTGSNATIEHGLSSKPGLIFIKRTSGSGENWQVYHSALGATKYASINLDSAPSTSSTRFQDTEPTSSLVTIGTESGLNTSSGTHVAYCWAPIEGYSKFGKYIGGGNADGPFVYLGFRPRLLWTFRTDSASGWRVRDTARDTYNPTDTIVWWNYDSAEASSSNYEIDLLGNGFKLRTSQGDFNADGSEYLWGAWGDIPFQYNGIFNS